MDSYSFYKSLYDRELQRRIHLDAAVNLPITILTIIGGSTVFLIENSVRDNITDILLLINLSCILMSVIFLALAYNNLFRGYSYENLPLSSELRTYQLQLEAYNKKAVEQKRIDVEKDIIDKINHVSDNYIQLNDKRSLYLYRSKTAILLSVCTIILLLIYYFLKQQHYG